MNLNPGDLFLYFLPLIAFCLVAEYLAAKELFDKRDIAANVGLLTGSVIMSSFTKFIDLGVYYFMFEALKGIRLDWFGYESLGWSWYIWVIALLASDFNYYWFHRWSHTVRILWASHITHHSAETFNFTTSLRNVWWALFYRFLFWAWMPLVGFHPVMVLFTMAVLFLYQFFVHSSRIPKLGILEKILVTPKIHEVHHCRNIEYLDKNYGAVTVIWDRLFNTYIEFDDEIEPEYGVMKGPESFNPLVIVTHAYGEIWQDVKQAKGLKDKFLVLFMPPGWRPDGTGKTARQLQTELAEAKMKGNPSPSAVSGKQ